MSLVHGLETLARLNAEHEARLRAEATVGVDVANRRLFAVLVDREADPSKPYVVVTTVRTAEDGAEPMWKTPVRFFTLERAEAFVRLCGEDDDG